jgi:hypothetical protein
MYAIKETPARTGIRNSEAEIRESEVPMPPVWTHCIRSCFLTLISLVFRLEVETLKQRRQIEKLLASPGLVSAAAAVGGGGGGGVGMGGGAGPTALEIRRDIEKTAVVRQLKLQVNMCSGGCNIDA